MIRWPILGLGVVGLSIVYRLAPSRGSKRWVSIGAIASTLLWLVASSGFSLYVARFGSYDKTYGSLGAVVILLMWFYLTAYIILAGAELNAEIARWTASSDAASGCTNTYDPGQRAVGGGLLGADARAAIGVAAGGGAGAATANGAAIGGAVDAVAGAATTPPRHGAIDCNQRHHAAEFAEARIGVPLL